METGVAPKVSSEHRQAVRDKILDAAAALIARKGYHETSMDDIVREGGLSKGAIYGHFDSKEAIFIAIQERQVAAVMDPLRAALDPKGPPLSRLRKAGELVFQDQAHRSREASRLSLQFALEASRIKSLRKSLRAQHAAVHRFLADLLREGIKEGEFRKDLAPDHLASLLLATFDGLSLLWATLEIDFDWPKMRATLAKVVEEGIRAR